VYIQDSPPYTKIYYNNHEYTHKVTANPSGTATDTLNTIGIDGTIYEIEGGGSGGAGTQIDVLFSKTPDNIHVSTITLSNSLFDYDEIAIDYVYVGNNIPYHIGHSYMTDDLNIGDNIGFESGGGNTWYSITNNTTLTLAQSQTAWCVVSIIGTKYGSGGSGGDVVIEYAEYAQFGGTQLVLPFTLNGDYTVEVDYQCLSYFSDQHVIGTSSGGGDRLHVTQYSSRWYYSRGTSEGNFEGTLTDRHVFTINDANNKVLFDGVVKDTYTPTTDNNLKLVIGGRSGGNYQGKIFNYKISSISQNKDLLNLIPARIKIGNVVIKEGLYDTIEGSMYTCNGMTIGGNGGGSTVIGTYIEPNSEEEPTETLENIKIDDTVYSVGGGNFYKKTTAEYQALPLSDKEDPDKLYFIDNSGEQITELDNTNWVNSTEANMSISIINNKLTYAWSGGTEIGANSVYSVAIPASVNKIRFSITTGTSYYNTYDPTVERFKVFIGVRPTYTTGFIYPPNLNDWLALKDFNTDNSVWEDELDLSNVSEDSYLYISGHGWNMTIDSLQLITESGDTTNNCIYYQNIKYADNASGGVPTVHYTTDEQVVGTYTDGNGVTKPVYQKTQIGGISLTSLGVWYDTLFTNIDQVLDVKGTILRDDEQVNLGYFTNSIGTCWICRNNNIKIQLSARQSGETYALDKLTVQYTKTTD
jgi:hypothetical protein